MAAKPKKKSTAKKKTREGLRAGIGAKGSRARPAGRDEGPKWRGGGTKGENEQTAR